MSFWKTYLQNFLIVTGLTFSVLLLTNDPIKNFWLDIAARVGAFTLLIIALDWKYEVKE